MNTSLTLSSHGYELDLSDAAFGELRRSDDVLTDEKSLRERMIEDGYLYLPGFFEREDVLKVRAELCSQLELAGRLDPDFPVIEAVPCPPDKTPAFPQNAQGFPVNRKHPTFERFLFGTSILDFYRRFFGGEVRHYDHTWFRAVNPGRGTPPHCDLVYMGRGTHEVRTAWIPYGDTSLELGGLIVLEGSHRQSERLKNYLAQDVDTYCENRPGGYKFKPGMLTKNPVTLREKMGGRWLTTEFKAGDLLTFGMKLVHASLDNQSNCIRLSTDTRYQLATQEIDPRWVGPDTVEYAAKNRIGLVC
ncbi:MAG: phytanoyl-CoA dioxygenase family protein [Methylacidiphilales bacterium]|nr:phytanoyl-CoA dioxygenase family protein [Candidatus Methylacidiphilales bacterium]